MKKKFIPLPGFPPTETLQFQGRRQGTLPQQPESGPPPRGHKDEVRISINAKQTPNYVSKFLDFFNRSLHSPSFFLLILENWEKARGHAPCLFLQEKRKKTDEKRYRPTKNKTVPVSHIHTCLLHLFTGHLTLFGVSADVTFQHPPHLLPGLY